ncbi:hypothetical protein D4764_12G0011790 [Takifugu flavidus]|uniref:Uncharacterized protein n=1 Tax=Takifugu flavidus TaxID=433684 RepID=A0A5C6PFK5_9TELE|nr:hypothetical protein D4764_12G0011790 [Takifugu flavidus]
MRICCWEEEERQVGNLRENKSLKYATVPGCVRRSSAEKRRLLGSSQLVGEGARTPPEPHRGTLEQGAGCSPLHRNKKPAGELDSGVGLMSTPGFQPEQKMTGW